MIKYIITAVVIYFLLRSFSSKPWGRKEIHIHHKKPMTSSSDDQISSVDDDYVEYEEVD